MTGYATTIDSNGAKHTKILYASVLAIDPGGTTGWAFVKDAELRAHEDSFDVVADQLAAMSEIEMVNQIMKMLKFFRRKDSQNHGVALVVEDFVPRQFDASRSFLSPVRLNAMLSYAISLEGWAVGIGNGIEFQSASTGKSTITDDYLRMSGYYLTSQPHANDAIRHALTYLRRIDNSGFIHLNACAYLWPGELDEYRGPKG
jgi:hypothetical protein